MTFTITHFAGPKFLRLFATAAILLALVQTAKADDNSDPLGDPYADPRNDVHNPLRYIASDTLTAIALSLLTISTVGLAWNMRKYGAKYMLCLVIGAAFFSLGIAMRFALARNPRSRGIYIIENLFVILSPCAFIAAIYILLGRLVADLGATAYLYVPAHRVTAIFLSSDIFTFLIQGTAGGLAASADQSKSKLGSKLFVVGLILQLVSFAFFASLYLSFLYRVHKNDKTIWHRDDRKPWYLNWRTLSVAISISCIGILIRSFYRVCELSEGWAGYLATHEGYFYSLDTLPLYITITIFIPFWPGKFIGVEPKAGEKVPTPKATPQYLELGQVDGTNEGRYGNTSTHVMVGSVNR